MCSTPAVDFVSLQYSYIIQQTGSENTQTHQVQVITLIAQQILATNLQGNVQQLEGRINNQILGVKGLFPGSHVLPFSPFPGTAVYYIINSRLCKKLLNFCNAHDFTQITFNCCFAPFLSLTVSPPLTVWISIHSMYKYFDVMLTDVWTQVVVWLPQ